MKVEKKPEPLDHSVWIIRGAPGVGKSAVGSRIKRILAQSAIIEVDMVRSMQSNVQWRDPKSHRLGLRQSTQLAKSFVSNGFKPVVIIDTLLNDELEYLKEYLKEKPWVVTLVASPEVLVKRARNRTSGFSHEPTIVEMNYQVSKDDRNTTIIDTSNLSADEVTEQILLMNDLSPSANF